MKRFCYVLMIGLLSFQHAYAERFVASGELGTSSIYITGFGFSFEPTWTLDFETTGQSITFHQFDVSYSGTIQFPSHPQVFIDLTVEGLLSNLTLDINPVDGFQDWQIEPYVFPIIRVAGTYHSFDFSNSFDVNIPHSSATFDSILDFANYPTSIDFGHVSGDPLSNELLDYNNINIELEPRLFLTRIILRMSRGDVLTAIVPVASADCPCCDCADFNSDDHANGEDFLIWQRGDGIETDAVLADGDGNGDGAVGWDDLAIWTSKYAQEPAVIANNIPEPSAAVLLLVGLLCMNQRKTVAPDAA